jgi:hypothetical protein
MRGWLSAVPARNLTATCLLPPLPPACLHSLEYPTHWNTPLTGIPHSLEYPTHWNTPRLLAPPLPACQRRLRRAAPLPGRRRGPSPGAAAAATAGRGRRRRGGRGGGRWRGRARGRSPAGAEPGGCRGRARVLQPLLRPRGRGKRPGSAGAAGAAGRGWPPRRRGVCPQWQPAVGESRAAAPPARGRPARCESSPGAARPWGCAVAP